MLYTLENYVGISGLKNFLFTNDNFLIKSVVTCVAQLLQTGFFQLQVLHILRQILDINVDAQVVFFLVNNERNL